MEAHGLLNFLETWIPCTAPLKGVRVPLKGVRVPLKGVRVPLKGVRVSLKGVRVPLKGVRGLGFRVFFLGLKEDDKFRVDVILWGFRAYPKGPSQTNGN